MLILGKLKAAGFEESAIVVLGSGPSHEIPEKADSHAVIRRLPSKMSNYEKCSWWLHLMGRLRW